MFCDQPIRETDRALARSYGVAAGLLQHGGRRSNRGFANRSQKREVTSCEQSAPQTSVFVLVAVATRLPSPVLVGRWNSTPCERCICTGIAAVTVANDSTADRLERRECLHPASTDDVNSAQMSPLTAHQLDQNKPDAAVSALQRALPAVPRGAVANGR